MPIERSTRSFSAARLRSVACELLDASSLCAIATVSPRDRAHVNTAYFAWGPELNIVWLSNPAARHSRNVRTNGKTAVAVYDSNQVWGKPDRGIQLFGSAREAAGKLARRAESLYEARFPAYTGSDVSANVFYRFRPARVKLFDEDALGSGVFVSARVGRGGRLDLAATEIYVTVDTPEQGFHIDARSQ
jgi:uncharacterized protein YhbP (UPF0306 family)